MVCVIMESKNLRIFLLGAATYPTLEIFWRGHTHWTMGIVGGACFLCICKLADKMNSCAMCKRHIINAGISTVIIRDTKDDYRIISVRDWIITDDSLTGEFGY